MRPFVLAFACCLVGCSAITSLDGIFEEGDATPDASAGETDPEDGDGGLVFPVEDAEPPPPCGAEEQPCCDKTPCNAGLECTSSKCAKPPPCGAEGQACCGGSACNSGLECRASDKICVTAAAPPPCGNSGQACCMGGACVGGLACNGTTCVPCGGSGQPCCGGTCGGGLVCNGTSCVPCGAVGQPCCIGSLCSGGWCSPVGCSPICYLRCCDNSLQAVHVTTEADCRNAYGVCADRGKTLRIQWNGVYIYERTTACP
jgi:hypothetical protein